VSSDPLRFESTAPPLRITLPAGYTALERPPNASLTILGTWQRPTPEGPVVLQLVRLDGTLPQRPLTPDERSLLHVSDPYPFVDRSSSRWALGFRLEALAGHSRAEGPSLVRYAVALPTRGDAVCVTVVTPAVGWRRASDDFDAVLRSAVGPRSWRTRGERGAEWVRVGAGLPATVLMLGYGLLALGCVLSRRRVPQPGWAFGGLGALWTVCGLAFVVPWSLAQPWPAVQGLGLGAVFLWRARVRWAIASHPKEA